MDLALATAHYHVGQYVGERGNLSAAVKYMRVCQKFLDNDLLSEFRWLLKPVVDGHIMFFQHPHNLVPSSRVAAKCKAELEIVSTMSGPEIFGRVGAAVHQWTSRMSAVELQTKALSIFLFQQGAVLQEERLKGLNLGFLPVAESITNSTRSILYPMTAPVATTAIVEASYLQTRYLLENKDNSKVLEDLKQNLMAMRLIALRSEVVELVHGNFMEELSTFIEKYEVIESMDFTVIRV